VTVALETRVRPAADVLFRQLGGEAVLLNLATGSYFGLNEVGARIWALLGAGETLRASLATLSAEYDASAEQLRADLLALVDELVANGLLVVESA
jgi:hypothetical protein